MIDILRQKSFFPLKNFESVEKLFEFNIDKNNGEPNLALLSIVAGLIEHSLVVISDKDDLIANSRSVEHRKDLFQSKSSSSGTKFERLSTSTFLPSTSNQNHLLSSTSSENSQNQPHTTISPKLSHDVNEANEAAFVSTVSFCNSNHERSLDERDHSRIDDELSANDNLVIPEIEYEIVETLYKRFVDQLKASIDLKDIDSNKVNLKIKKISDSVWAHLSNSYYKDKAHLQSIFSYLTTSKLDCFGLAFAVLAGCQALQLKNIYLALSEDHAWVMFDDDQNKDKQIKSYTDNNLPIPSCAMHGTCEVTWHGKANSDKRGQPVTFKNCWLYTNGYAVKCDFRKCVLALVNSLNPSINSNTDSEILALLQQRLLWMLYKKKYYFPMSLGNLGELENLCPTPGAPLKPIELFHLGIEISRNEYNDSHVYPYTYLASHFYRHGRFKEALETWADASYVMTKYNYSRDDEEIYKEFFEVANELIPSILKVMTAGGIEPGRGSLKPFLQDPECLALILKFYDNICVWEEGSSTPVLHIGWAKNFVATVLKFSPHVRSRIKLLTEDEWNDSTTCTGDTSENVVSSRADHDHNNQSQQHCTTSIDSTDQSSVHHDANDEQGSSTRQSRASHNNDIVAEPNNDNEAKNDDRLPFGTVGSRKRPKDHSTNNDNQDRATKKSRMDDKISQRAMIRSIKVEGDNVTIILKSSKIAGVRDLLHADRLNKTAIELQLTAQSQCAVRGRSNSTSYSLDFIPTSAITSMVGTTRSKRLQR